MRTLDRTAKKITVEATKNEIAQKGFDNLWDELREIYPKTLYDIDTIRHCENDKIIIIILKLVKP
jgi:hypothetical protein